MNGPRPDLTVAKVGGSLYDLPDLGGRLRAWLDATPGRVLLVPGGGAAADVVRGWDAIHGLGEERAHWLALRSLTLTGHWLAELLGGCRVLGPAAWAAAPDRCTVLDAYEFAAGDEGRPGALPHVWEATSDSVAARAAVALGAARLCLLKSVDIPGGADWRREAERGHVDRVFPSVVAQAGGALGVTAVNFRAWRPEPAV